MTATEVWRYLHDGVIQAIRGEMPGTVVVDVSIRYLRQRFPGAGTGFTITLNSCTRFEYHPYDEPPRSDFAAIVGAEPEILGLESSDPVVVNCVMGVLRLAYRSAAIALDSGPVITLTQLAEASRDYWDEWSKGPGRVA